MSDYTELVQRLREQYMDTKQMLPNVLCHDSADAITALQARVAELKADIRNLLDNDLKAATCVQIQRELNEAQADLAAARAESDLAHWLLRNARKYMNPMHEALCAAIDNVLQKKQSALAKTDAGLLE